MNYYKFLGKYPICNKKKERTFHIGNFYFPLCYRCTFIIIGELTGKLILPQEIISIKYDLIISLLLLIPCCIDGILQYKFNIYSTNKRRIWTGYLAGIGFTIMHNAYTLLY